MEENKAELESEQIQQPNDEKQEKQENLEQENNKEDEIEQEKQQKEQKEQDEVQNVDECDFYGINKWLYRKVSGDEYQEIMKQQGDFWENSKGGTYPIDMGIKTGTDFVLLPRNPEFLQNSEPYEPMYIPKQTILEESIRREVERICFADTLINRVVYDCSDPSLYTKDVDPKNYDMDILPFYIPQNQDDITLVFESKFESGNLRRAIQICDYEYNLILKPDYFTTGHTQWYYFSIANVRKNVEYRFNIINMMKPDSLYNSGMKPLCYSEKQAKYKKIGFYRDGYDICYYQNNMKRKNGGFYYTLTFTLKFQYDYDNVYLTHCYPYTYSQLCRYLRVIENDPIKKNRVKRKTICQTVAGNNCDCVVIGDNNNGKEKKGILLTSRVHPGETMASYTIENIMEFLIGNTIEAKQLRENFIFKIVPMLNIDGVINGNYRCNLSGVDLNRQWIDPSKKLHPTIFSTKIILRKMKEDKDLMLYCDFHGHSRKKNIFMYGCAGRDPNKKEQIFPMLMRNNSSVFSFKDCQFLIQKDREGSARIALWRELNIINCYTLEISFCGADIGKYEYFHFNLDIYKEVSQSFCISLLDCYEPEQVKVKQVCEELEQMLLKNEKKEVDKNQNSGDEDSDYSNDDDKKDQNNQNGESNNNNNNNNAQQSKEEGKNNQDKKKGNAPKKTQSQATKSKK